MLSHLLAKICLYAQGLRWKGIGCLSKKSRNIMLYSSRYKPFKVKPSKNKIFEKNQIYYHTFVNNYNTYIPDDYLKYKYLKSLTFNCHLKNIPILPQGLEYLDMGSCKITEIKNIPSKVKILKLYLNSITKIENLPEGLKRLDLDINHIEKIENLPSTLKILFIRHNLITVIENLGEHLKFVNIRNNPIDKIITLPQKLHIIANGGVEDIISSFRKQEIN